MNFALRNLRYDRLRLGLSITGVALALMLVVLLNGLLSGMYAQVSAYLNHSPGSLVVAQRGITNLLGATSLVPTDSAEAVAHLEGVERVAPILSQFVVIELHGRKQPLYLIGYEPNLGGGPWRLSEGRAPRADNEIVFDSVLAERHGVQIGDEVTVLGRPLQVTGLSAETTSWMTSYVFVRKSAAESLLRAPGATSFILVTPKPNISDEDLAEQLRAVPGIEVVTRDTMVQNDLRLLARFFSAPVRLMVGIAFLIGSLVVALVIYTATAERRREFGVLKAIGMRNRHLYGIVMIQAGVTTAAGAVVGLGLAVLASRVIEWLRPQFLVVLTPSALIWVLAAALVMATVAALMPALLVARLAPSEVFRRAA